MEVYQELFYDFETEAVQELLCPVLYRVDVTRLQPPQLQWLISAQKTQKSFIRGARRFYAGGVSFPDVYCLGEIWNTFKEAITPAEFDRATEYINLARQEAFRRAREHNAAINRVIRFTNVLIATGAMPKSRNFPERATELLQKNIQLEDEFYGSLVRLFKRENPPFLLHYAVTAMAINNMFDIEFRTRLTDEQVASLKGTMPEVKISPQGFPYQKPLLVIAGEKLPDGTSDLDGLLQWYVNGKKQLAREATSMK